MAFFLKLLVSLLIFAGIAIPGCTAENDNAEFAQLQKNIERLEREISSVEQSLKTAPAENANSLQQDRDLAKSRLERLKERLKPHKP